jgi:hypothetical protein
MSGCAGLCIAFCSFTSPWSPNDPSIIACALSNVGYSDLLLYIYNGYCELHNNWPFSAFEPGLVAPFLYAA